MEAAAEGGGTAFDIEYVPADVTTPEFRDIHIRDIVCSGAARAMYFNGIPEKNISNIVVEDCLIVSDKGADIRYSDGVVLSNVDIRHSEGERFTVANCRNVVVEGCGESSVFQYNNENVTVKR